MVWRIIVEGGIFLSELVWVYVLQTFGADKEQDKMSVSVLEVERMSAKDVERISSIDGLGESGREKTHA
jgi:hypothetical protein